ncbi:uncharacterized protein LOC135484640 [Lineus longissimus]|uniref:uncharacterized protein LOC135484640 n=1 Tax=Lineus longissimus TaxID=88925 RepID=UPI00315D2C48
MWLLIALFLAQYCGLNIQLRKRTLEIRTLRDGEYNVVLFRIPSGVFDSGSDERVSSIALVLNDTRVVLPDGPGLSQNPFAVIVPGFSTKSTTSSKQPFNGTTTVPSVSLARALSTTSVRQSASKFGHIPHIIHQTWKSAEVPVSMKKFIESWRSHHPQWEYWFWRDQDIQEFVRLKYPWFLPTYNSYTMTIMKADVFRYLILHEFGGVYADLDMECLRPLDDFVAKRSCILSQEPLEHAFLLYGRSRLACNAMMACKPKHPFFKYLLHQLPIIQSLHNKRNDSRNVLTISGPLMLEQSLQLYEKNLTAAKNKSATAAEDSEVHVASPRELMPIFDRGQSSNFRSQCQTRKTRRSEVCRELRRRAYSNNVGKDSYTVHHWIHFWADWWKKGYGDTTHIRNVIPDVVNLTTRGIF